MDGYVTNVSNIITRIWFIRVHLFSFSSICILVTTVTIHVFLYNDKCQCFFYQKAADCPVTTTESTNNKCTSRFSRHKNKFTERSEVRHVGYLKVHKAGSTMMQNMFFRFGLKHNLTFLLPETTLYFHPSSMTPLKAINDHYDILAVHSKFSKSKYDKYLPSDKVNIAIVRDPLQRFFSAAYYYRDVRKNEHLLQIPRETLIHELINNHEKYDNAICPKLKNSMAKDFGFSQQIKETDTALILNYLRHLQKEFILVLVLERLDESLVLMKRCLHWKMSDIIFLRINSNEHGLVNLNKEWKEKHRKVNYLDYALYDFFEAILNSQIKVQDDGFKQEVDQFRHISNLTRVFCNTPDNYIKVLIIHASPWNSEFRVSRSDCKMMSMTETNFLSLLRERHIRMHGRS